jgi:hypothetical protein
VQPFGEVAEGVVGAQARPVLALGRRGAGVGDTGVDHPVGQAGVWRFAGADRVEDELGDGVAGDHHAVAAVERGPVHRASPHLDAVPSDAGIVGVQQRAQGGVDAVRADQSEAGDISRAAVLALESCGDVVRVLGDVEQAVGWVKCGRAETVDGGLPQHGVQAAAVDGELGHFVAGEEAARFAPDLLAEVVGVSELAGADGDLVQVGEEAERG